MRLFFAVDLPDTLRHQIASATAHAREVAPRVAWVAPALLHITVKFLGECDESMERDVRARAREVVRGVAPIAVSLEGGGAFPNFWAPRVVWIGMRHAQPLVQLAQRLDDALATLGLERDRRPFRPHLTLGRVKTPLARDVAAQLELALRTLRSSWPLQLTNLSLMQSQLSAAGPRYSTRAEFALGGA